MWTDRKAGRHAVFPMVGMACALGVSVALAVLLAACGGQSAGGQQRGTLSGTVVAGPTCPVESVTAPCPPRPVSDRRVTIVTPSGAVVDSVSTDQQGRFLVQLAPGAYVVQVAIIPGTPGLRQLTPGNVVVTAGATTQVTIELDTGIR